MKKKVKPTSVRLDNELLEEVDQRCGELGCSRNDFIKNSVDFIINQSSGFDFGDDEESKGILSIIEKEGPEPITQEKMRSFNCKSGMMYENGIVIGDCADFHLDYGKVFDKTGKQIGLIDSKPKELTNMRIVSN